MTQTTDPHSLNRNPDSTLRYWIADLQTMDTPNFPAYAGTLTENGVPVATFHNDGRGGATFVEYLNPQAREEFQSFLQQYPDLLFEHCTVPMEAEFFIEELANQHQIDEQARTNTMCLSEQVSGLGSPDLYALPGQFTLEQLRAWPQRPHHLTHMWVRGQGWMPLRDAP